MNQSSSSYAKCYGQESVVSFLSEFKEKSLPLIALFEQKFFGYGVSKERIEYRKKKRKLFRFALSKRSFLSCLTHGRLELVSSLKKLEISKSQRNYQ